ncbi:MAG: hypothetical protein V1873_01385 [Verrucomicrobiota bacterium]
MAIDARKEQEATLARGRMKYSLMARMLFEGMDLVYGKDLTLPKVRLLEILARIPYQAWEIRQYRLLNSRFADPAAVQRARDIMQWGRAAQDNEFWHLRVVTERMARLGVRDTWFRDRLVRRIAAFKYVLFSHLLARFNIQRAFLLNAEFEDHAEHEYMQFVADHPELEKEKVDNRAAAEGGAFASWADVFRRIGLDERDHMNESLIHCGRAAQVVPFVSQTP